MCEVELYANDIDMLSFFVLFAKVWIKIYASGRVMLALTDKVVSIYLRKHHISDVMGVVEAMVVK